MLIQFFKGGIQIMGIIKKYGQWLSDMSFARMRLWAVVGILFIAGLNWLSKNTSGMLSDVIWVFMCFVVLHQLCLSPLYIKKSSERDDDKKEC